MNPAYRKIPEVSSIVIERGKFLERYITVLNVYATHRDSGEPMRLWSETLDPVLLSDAISQGCFFRWLQYVVCVSVARSFRYEMEHASCSCSKCGIDGLIADLFDTTEGMLCRFCLQETK